MTTPDYTKGHSIVLTGLAQWAKVTEASGPSEFSKKYQLNLILSKESIDDLANLGERVYAAVVKVEKMDKETEQMVRVAPFITAKSNNLPQVFTLDKKAYAGLIGNDSLLRIKCTLKAYEYMGKKGLTVYLNGVLIMELKEYSGKSIDDLWQGLDYKPADDLPF